MKSQEYKIVLKEIENLYLEKGKREGFFYEDIKDLISKIDEFNFSDFLKYMLEESLDSLWIEFSILLHSKFAKIPCLEIISLLESLSSKFERLVLLVYLCKYLEIDGFLVLDKSNLQTKNKMSLEHFVKNNKEFLTKSSEDIEKIERYNRVSIYELKRSGEKITNCLLQQI